MGRPPSDRSPSSDEDPVSSRSNSLSIRSGSSRRSSDSGTDSTGSDVSSVASSERSVTKYHPEYSYRHGQRKRDSRRSGHTRDHRLQPYAGLKDRTYSYSDSGSSSVDSIDAMQEVRAIGAYGDQRNRDWRRAAASNIRTFSSGSDSDYHTRKPITPRRAGYSSLLRNDTIAESTSTDEAIGHEGPGATSPWGPGGRRRLQRGPNYGRRYVTGQHNQSRRSGIIGGLTTLSDVLRATSMVTGLISHVLGRADGGPPARRPMPPRSHNHRPTSNFTFGHAQTNNHSLPPERRRLGQGRGALPRYLQN